MAKTSNAKIDVSNIEICFVKIDVGSINWKGLVHDTDN